MGSEMLYKMLKELDPIHAKKINIFDEKRIIRALEIHKASGIQLSTMVGYKNKDYLSDTLIPFINLEYLMRIDHYFIQE